MFFIFFFVGDDKLILSSLLSEANTVDVNKSASYVHSPIGKIMVENIDDNLDSASIYVKEKNLIGRPVRNDTIQSSNDKNNSCIFFVCMIYFYD